MRTLSSRRAQSGVAATSMALSACVFETRFSLAYPTSRNRTWPSWNSFLLRPCLSARSNAACPGLCPRMPMALMGRLREGSSRRDM
ncbi:hypothetical protein DUNSADRAFT_15233 [Dunaliella salina]|uniref:Secreted protein n=1 Tax=Dunaliella salina TaxID=3046 RepID=A0ABQ7H228_DUNSA|nr:hypothetical protein DUNSADRAFT_15233 [Dunaliella salina]|eukprot:KAF5840865.1 hypothetical protein DUNSADRAFT_15233 [Dunaliella salina]